MPFWPVVQLSNKLGFNMASSAVTYYVSITVREPHFQLKFVEFGESENDAREFYQSLKKAGVSVRLTKRVSKVEVQSLE